MSAVGLTSMPTSPKIRTRYADQKERGGLTMKRIGERTTKWTGGFLCVLVVAACTMITRASTPVGVTPTLIGRGTFETFKVTTDAQSRFDFMAPPKPAVDMVVTPNGY